MINWESCILGIVRDESFLAKLEGTEVDGGVRKHADESHGETAVGGADESFFSHLLEGGDDELVAAEAVLFDVTLHAELEGVEWIDAESADN